MKPVVIICRGAVVSCLLLVVFAFVWFPSSAAASSTCSAAVGKPVLCESQYAPQSAVFLLKGAGFTPGGTVHLTITDTAKMVDQHISVHAGALGTIQAFELGFCYATPVTIVAQDGARGKKTAPHHAPACSPTVLAGMLPEIGPPPPPSLCDVETPTPSLCGTGFDGDEQTSGTLTLYGTGFPAGTVHLHLTGTGVTVPDYSTTVDDGGILIADSPIKVPCFVNDAAVTATDPARHVTVHYAAPPPCILLSTPGSTSGGGSQVRFVPIGLLVAGGAALMRRLRRRGM